MATVEQLQRLTDIIDAAAKTHSDDPYLTWRAVRSQLDSKEQLVAHVAIEQLFGSIAQAERTYWLAHPPPEDFVGAMHIDD